MPPVLEIRDLSVHYRLEGRGSVVALDGAGLHVGEGETVGLLGESASGKSTILDAVLGLLPDSATVTSGSIRFRGRELLGLRAREMRPLLGAAIGFVPQDPSLALNPVRRVLSQVAEIVAAHDPRVPAGGRADAAAALASVGLTDAVHDAYPHELSGGQRQRVTIAQALCCGAELLLADEPTAALDSVTQADLRGLLAGLRRSRGMSMLLVSHDVGTLWALADRVCVLHEGRIVESGPTDAVFRDPTHDHTRALLSAAPRPRAAAALGG